MFEAFMDHFTASCEILHSNVKSSFQAIAYSPSLVQYAQACEISHKHVKLVKVCFSTFHCHFFKFFPLISSQLPPINLNPYPNQFALLRIWLKYYQISNFRNFSFIYHSNFLYSNKINHPLNYAFRSSLVLFTLFKLIHLFCHSIH